VQPEHYIKLVADLLVNDGNQVVPAELPNFGVKIGYQKMQFGTLFATTLHLFTVVVVVSELNASTYDTIVSQSINYILKNNATLLGFRKKIAVTPIIAAQAVDTETEGIACAMPNSKYTVITSPVIVDITNVQTYTYGGKVKNGKKYINWIRERLSASLPVIQKQPVNPEEF